MINIRFVLGLGLCTLLTTAVQAAEITASPPVGQKVDNFVLNDFYGKPHALADYNWEGLHQPPRLELGTMGSDARALGGALLPLHACFAPDTDIFLKA